MNTKTAVMSLVLLSGVCVAPASANWFSNPIVGLNLNVGSAPNPTPGDLRAIGDSRYRAARIGVAEDVILDPSLLAMEGRTVYGTDGERLGYVLAVDQTTNSVDLQTRDGVAVAMSADLIVDRGNRLVAPTMSILDVRDMARLQTGRTVALID